VLVEKKCKALAPASTGTKTQGDRKWLSDRLVKYTVSEVTFRSKLTLVQIGEQDRIDDKTVFNIKRN